MLATLASFGYANVKVGRHPRVAVLATGSELVAVDEQPGRDQIRDSNNFSIGSYAELAGAQVERLPLAGDDIALLKHQIREAAERSDVVVTSGGVSMGVYDFTKAALRNSNARSSLNGFRFVLGNPLSLGDFPAAPLFLACRVTRFQFQ